MVDASASRARLGVTARRVREVAKKRRLSGGGGVARNSRLPTSAFFHVVGDRRGRHSPSRVVGRDTMAKSAAGKGEKTPTKALKTGRVEGGEARVGG